MDRNSPGDEWELSKENVQPLKQGRKFSRLTEGLQPQSNEKLHKIREEKQAFEAEVRTYTGDDPLDVWYRYIRWAEESFPKGGKESNLTTILERCVQLFKDEEVYRNDERYIYAWIKTAEACNEPLEIYNFMYDQNIGCEVSRFYESWAGILEQLGNNKRADAIYLKGIKKGAQPQEGLLRKHAEFQKRVARQFIQGSMDETENESPVSENQRQVLSQLKTSGKRHAIPVNRTGGNIQGGAGVVSGARPKTVQQVPSKTIPIYSDENADPSMIPAQTGEWTKAPHRNQMNKENEKKAGVWNKAKVPQASKNIPISAVNTFRQPTFSVHIDENDQVMSTPAKMPEIGNQVLSARKPEKPTSYIQQIKEPAKDESQKPMYCKDKIYCGAEEYSFEELRGVRWFKKEEQRQREEEEARALEECRQKLEAEKQALLDDVEKVRQERIRLREEQHAMLQEARRNLAEEQEKFQRERELRLQEQQQMMEMDIQKRMHEQAAQTQALMKTKTKPAMSARQLAFDDGGHGNTENIPPQMIAQMRASASKPQPFSQQQRGLQVHQSLRSENLELEMQHARLQEQQDSDRVQAVQGGRLNTSQNTSIRTPSSFIIPTSHPSSGEQSFDRTLSGVPSPTVNTKEAMKLVMGMFNASLELDKPALLPEDVDMVEPIPAQQEMKAPSGGLPFVIYDESQENRQPKTAPAPFKIFEDQENRCPPDEVKPPKRKSLSGILQPSVEVPSDPTEEKDCIVLEEQEPNTRGPFEDENMDHIESHARDDVTIAPVGSHLSFAAAARFASTPFNPNSSGGGGHCKSLNDSDVSMIAAEPEPQAHEPMAEDKQPSIQDQTAPNTTEDSGNSSRKNLSPIMEGSSEENDSHGKSQHGHHSTIVSLKPVSEILERSEHLHISANSSVNSGTRGHKFEALSAMKSLESSLEQNEDTNFLLSAAAAECNQSQHLIDTSTYIPPELDEKTENLMSMSICIADPKDPFDTETIEKFLKLLQKPLTLYDNYCALDGYLPEFSKGTEVFLGQSTYKVKKKIGEGGFAKVFVAEFDEFDTACMLTLGEKNNTVAIKVQKPASKWEFYICNEINSRLAELKDPVDVILEGGGKDILARLACPDGVNIALQGYVAPHPRAEVLERPAMMEIQDGFFYNNGSCLVTEYHPHGTLLDLVNRCRHLNLQNMEPVMAYMTIELLHMVENLHKCQIIHGDIKPDNFLLLQFPVLPVSDDPRVVFRGKQRFAKLIDFGQSIDMTKYPPNTTFMAKVNTKCFQCIEMKTNRPWTYQTDLFGLAGTIHVLLFDQYMNVYPTGGEWCMTKSFTRNWNTTLWKRLFHTLLNVPSCDELPDLSIIRRQFELFFVSELLPKYNIMSASFMKTLKT